MPKEKTIADKQFFSDLEKIQDPVFKQFSPSVANPELWISDTLSEVEAISSPEIALDKISTTADIFKRYGTYDNF